MLDEHRSWDTVSRWICSTEKDPNPIQASGTLSSTGPFRCTTCRKAKRETCVVETRGGSTRVCQTCTVRRIGCDLIYIPRRIYLDIDTHLLPAVENLDKAITTLKTELSVSVAAKRKSIMASKKRYKKTKTKAKSGTAADSSAWTDADEEKLWEGTVVEQWTSFRREIMWSSNINRLLK